ncbi:MAG: hypothetical protein AB8G22_28330 [Saprospiraceae bacterium]
MMFVFAQERAVPIQQDVYYSNINHGGTNIILNGVDGERSVILCDLFSLTLVEPDQDKYVIIPDRHISILTNPDGSNTTVHHHSNTSVLMNADGSHYVVQHDRRSSSLFSPYGTHIILHRGSCRDKAIDVLAHKKWIDMTIASKGEVKSTETISKKKEKKTSK